MNTDEARKKALVDLAERDDDEPCLAFHGMAVLDALDFDDFDAAGMFEKLKGRPAGEVRRFTKEAKAASQEMRQHMLSRFAKAVRPL